MKHTYFLIACILVVACTVARAAETTSAADSTPPLQLSPLTSSVISTVPDTTTVIPKDTPRELQFLALFYNHAVVTNMYSANAFTGEIVGRLYGANQTKTDKGAAMFFEQRLLPFFLYSPKLFNGKAILRSVFEVDWTWGDESYLFGGNRGGAFNGGRVNIQTQNVEVELLPGNGWQLNIGLQRLFDTPYNPYRTLVPTMFNTGYRLAYFGSHGAGVSVRKESDWWRLKSGMYQLYEREIEQANDVVLWESMVEFDITPTWRQGFSAWYLYDRANDQAGISTIGEGLTSNLPAWTGAYQWSFPYSNPADINNRHTADILWLGTFWGVNPECTMGRWGMSGFVNVNLGSVNYHDGEWKKAADIMGVGASIRAMHRYGQTNDDAVTADLVFSTGDKNGSKDGMFNGVITGNTYGFPGAIFVGHGAYILLPHGNVVNRFVSAVGDLSNMGYGLSAITLNASTGIIPNKLSAKVGAAFAFSNVAPPNGGNIIGTELNARLVYNLGVYMSVEWHNAHAWLGDFYTSSLTYGQAPRAPVNPWWSQVVFRWLMF